MVLPFQDDNLSIEYSQFRQNGLLKKKKKKIDRMTLRFFFFFFKYHFFFPKMTRTVVTWLEMRCLCSQNKKKSVSELCCLILWPQKEEELGGEKRISYHFVSVM